MTFENPTYEEAVEMVNRDFKQRYGKTLDEMIISVARGYWRDKNYCRGSCGTPHPRPIHHTYYFSQPGRGRNGQFLRVHRAWEAIRCYPEQRDEMFERFGGS